MRGWKECKLGDILTLEYGKSLQDYKDVQGEYPVYGTNGKIGYSNSFLSPIPSVIIGRKGAYRGIHFSSVPFFVIDTAFYVKPKSKDFDMLFLYNYLLTLDINAMDSGSAIPSTDRYEIYDIDFNLPPLPEQRAIASVLSSLDDKIDLLNRQNKTLEAMAETLFRQWFVEEAGDSWTTVHIGDYVTTNISSIDKDFKLQTIRYLDTGSLTEGKIESYQTFELADAPSRARRIVNHNDVLISTVRPNQKHYGILNHPDEDIIVSTGFCVITSNKINPHFIYTLLTTTEMTEFLHSIAEGSTSTYPSLKPSDIEKLEFQLPPEEKLNSFSAYAVNAWEKIDYNHKQILTLEKLRDVLLPKLMSGEVRIASEYHNV